MVYLSRDHESSRPDHTPHNNPRLHEDKYRCHQRLHRLERQRLRTIRNRQMRPHALPDQRTPHVQERDQHCLSSDQYANQLRPQRGWIRRTYMQPGRPFLGKLLVWNNRSLDRRTRRANSGLHGKQLMQFRRHRATACSASNISRRPINEPSNYSTGRPTRESRPAN